MTVYVAEIFGRAVVAFDAASETEAQARFAERPLQRDLIVLQSGGRPLWDGTSTILLRLAAPQEAETWRASHAAAAASSRSAGEGWHVFLVPVVDPSREALDDDDDDDHDDDRGD